MESTLQEVLPLCIELTGVEESPVDELSSLAALLKQAISMHRESEQPASPYEIFDPGLWEKNSLIEQGESGIALLKSTIPVCIELATQQSEALMFSGFQTESMEYRELTWHIRQIARNVTEADDIPDDECMTRYACMLSAAYLSRISGRKKFADLDPCGFGSKHLL